MGANLIKGEIMADVKISGLPASTVPLAGTEVLPVVQGGVTKQVSVNNLTAGKAVSAAQLDVDNVRVDGNTISSTNTNGDITIDPNGAGLVVIPVPATTAVLASTPTVLIPDTIGNRGGFGFQNASGGTLGAVVAEVVATGNYPTAVGKMDFVIQNGFASFDVLSLKTNYDVAVNYGNLVIGTSGKGIDFSATPGTGTSELLADYEEGNWTPVITAAGGTITSYTSSGTYTKIGRSVTLTCTFTITDNGTGIGGVIVSGVPFSMVGGVGGAARETSVNGNISSVSANTATQLILYNYANLYPAATGAAFAFSLVFNT